MIRSIMDADNWLDQSDDMRRMLLPTLDLITITPIYSKTTSSITDTEKVHDAQYYL